MSILKKYDVKVIGFVNENKLYKSGKMDRSRLKLLDIWLQNGHKLGNHTFSHISFNENSLEDYKMDFIKGENMIKERSQYYKSNFRYFRYPFLQTGNDSLKKYGFIDFLKSKGYVNSPITFDIEDYIFNKVYMESLKKKDKKSILKVKNQYIEYVSQMVDYFEKITQTIAGKQIKQTFLCHINMINTDCFEEIIKLLIKKEYKFISIDEALNEPFYQSKETYIGKGGFSWLHRWRKTQNIKFTESEPTIPEEIMKVYNGK